MIFSHMIDKLKAKLSELDSKKTAVKPKIDEINKQKEEEIQVIKDKYDQQIAEVNAEIDKFEVEVYNDLINSYVTAVMDEFDAKRSVSEYSVTNKIKDYKIFIESVEIFPKELVEKLEPITSGKEPIENLAYDIDNIKTKYLK